MKVAVATNNYKNIVGHVGMCKGFLLYEVKDGKILDRKEIINPFTKINDAAGNSVHHNHNSEHHHDGGDHHHHNHSDLSEALKGMEFMLCKKAGPGLIQSLSSQGIKVLFTEERFGDDAVIKLENKTLGFTDPISQYFN